MWLSEAALVQRLLRVITDLRELFVLIVIYIKSHSTIILSCPFSMLLTPLLSSLTSSSSMSFSTLLSILTYWWCLTSSSSA